MTDGSARPAILSSAIANMLLATFAFSVMNVFVKQLNRIPAMGDCVLPLPYFGSDLLCGNRSRTRRLEGR